MNKFSLILVVFGGLLVSSCNQAGSAVTSPYVEPKNVQKGETQQEPEKEPEKKSTELPPIQTEIQKPPTVPKPVKMDQAILGEYRLELDPVQLKQIDLAIEKMKENMVNDSKASPAYEMAIKAREMARNMKVKLVADGRYIADFGQGQSNGSFTPTSDGVLLKPDRQTGDPADPTDVELIFDKKNRTLTATYQGENMVFKKS